MFQTVMFFESMSWMNDKNHIDFSHEKSSQRKLYFLKTCIKFHNWKGSFISNTIYESLQQYWKQCQIEISWHMKSSHKLWTPREYLTSLSKAFHKKLAYQQNRKKNCARFIDSLLFDTCSGLECFFMQKFHQHFIAIRVDEI